MIMMNTTNMIMGGKLNIPRGENEPINNELIEEDTLASPTKETFTSLLLSKLKEKNISKEEIERIFFILDSNSVVDMHFVMAIFSDDLLTQFLISKYNDDRAFI